MNFISLFSTEFPQGTSYIASGFNKLASGTTTLASWLTSAIGNSPSDGDGDNGLTYGSSYTPGVHYTDTQHSRPHHTQNTNTRHVHGGTRYSNDVNDVNASDMRSFFLVPNHVHASAMSGAGAGTGASLGTGVSSAKGMEYRRSDY